MIRPDQIPDEVVWKLHDKLWKVGGLSVDEVRDAIAAALNAWPDSFITKYSEGAPALNIPLPTEASDD